MTKILVVDDEESIRNSFSRFLSNDGCKVDVAVGINDARTFISMNEFDVAVIDRIQANGQNGIELARYLNHIQPSCETIIMSAFPTFKSASETLKLNTFRYLTKPVRQEELRKVVRNAVENGRRKKEAKQIESVMQLIFDSSPSGIMTCDLSFNVMSINSSFTQIMGYKKNDVLGQRIEGLPFWEGAKRDDEIVNNIKQEPGKTWDISWKTKDNRCIDIILSQYIYDNGTNGSGYILIMIHDVTQYRHMEQYIEKAQQIETIGLVARTLAHDMSNIIMVILSYSDIMMNEFPAQSGLRKYVKEIIKASERADTLLKQIMILSRETSEEKNPIKSGPFIRDVLCRVTSKLEKNITIKQRLNDDCNEIIGDRDLLFRMLTNLIENAAQSIGENNGVIEVMLDSATFKRRTTIHAGTLKKGAYTVITVKDTGSGMDEETLEHMFEPFFTTRMDKRHTGVGLTIVQEIVRKHKGAITVESKPGNGTNISVYFPVHASWRDMRNDS